MSDQITKKDIKDNPDWEFVKAVNFTDDHLDKYQGEYFGHYAAYKSKVNVQDGDIIEYVSLNGDVKKYKVHIIESTNSDLVSRLFEPLDPKDTWELTFQGTSSMQGWVRNTESLSAGRLTFENDKQHILEQINTIIGNKGNIDLRVSGHSLGGADSQRMYTVLMNAIAQNNSYLNPDYKFEDEIPADIRSNLNNVTSLRLATQDASGISYKYGDMAKSLGENFFKNMKSPTGEQFLQYHSIIGEGDPVQQTGQTNIFADIDPSIAKVELTKFFEPELLSARNSAARKLLAYTASLGALGFVSVASGGSAFAIAALYTGITMGYGALVHMKSPLMDLNPHTTTHCNDNDAGRKYIKNELTNKTSFLNNRVMPYVQEFGNAVLNTMAGGNKKDSELVYAVRNTAAFIKNNILSPMKSAVVAVNGKVQSALSSIRNSLSNNNSKNTVDELDNDVKNTQDVQDVTVTPVEKPGFVNSCINYFKEKAMQLDQKFDEKVLMPIENRLGKIKASATKFASSIWTKAKGWFSKKQETVEVELVNIPNVEAVDTSERKVDSAKETTAAKDLDVSDILDVLSENTLPMLFSQPGLKEEIKPYVTADKENQYDEYGLPKNKTKEKKLIDDNKRLSSGVLLTMR